MRIAAIAISLLLSIWLLATVWDAQPAPHVVASPSDALTRSKLVWLIDQRTEAFRHDRIRSVNGLLFAPGTPEPLTGVLVDGEPGEHPRFLAEVRDGVPHGAIVGFYDDGSVAFVRNHALGVPFGRVIEYDATGAVRLDAIANGALPSGELMLDALDGPAVDGIHDRHGDGLIVRGFDWTRAISDADVRDERFDKPLLLPKEPGGVFH